MIFFDTTTTPTSGWVCSFKGNACLSCPQFIRCSHPLPLAWIWEVYFLGGQFPWDGGCFPNFITWQQWNIQQCYSFLCVLEWSFLWWFWNHSYRYIHTLFSPRIKIIKILARFISGKHNLWREMRAQQLLLVDEIMRAGKVMEGRSKMGPWLVMIIWKKIIISGSRDDHPWILILLLGL